MLPSTPRTFIGSTTFTVTGMTCAHCQRAVTEEISAVAGVESVTVDLATGTVTVTAAPTGRPRRHRRRRRRGRLHPRPVSCSRRSTARNPGEIAGSSRPRTRTISPSTVTRRAGERHDHHRADQRLPNRNDRDNRELHPRHRRHDLRLLRRPGREGAAPRRRRRPPPRSTWPPRPPPSRFDPDRVGARRADRRGHPRRLHRHPAPRGPSPPNRPTESADADRAGTTATTRS